MANVILLWSDKSNLGRLIANLKFLTQSEILKLRSKQSTKAGSKRTVSLFVCY